MYIYDHISLNSSWKEKCLRQNCRGDQNTYSVHSLTSFQKSCRFLDNVEKDGRATQVTDNTMRRMRFACWMSNVRHTHSEYVTLLVFLLQQWLQERAL
jgi:hypothetical protein